MFVLLVLQAAIRNSLATRTGANSIQLILFRDNSTISTSLVDGSEILPGRESSFNSVAVGVINFLQTHLLKMFIHAVVFLIIDFFKNSYESKNKLGFLITFFKLTEKKMADFFQIKNILFAFKVRLIQ